MSKMPKCGIWLAVSFIFLMLFLDDDQEAFLQEYRERLLEEEQMIRDFAWERPRYMWEELKILEDF